MPKSLPIDGLTPEKLWAMVQKAQQGLSNTYQGLTKSMVYLWHLHMEAAMEVARVNNIHPRRIQVAARSVPGESAEAMYLEGSGLDVTCWRMPVSDDAGHWDENPLFVVSRIYRPGDETVSGLRREGAWLSLT